VSDSAFAAKLTKWFDAAKRDLPWRNTRDPYRILVSEIMLQQTRAQAVIPYYQKFLESFPTAQALARASEAEVLRRWSGLGYYQRARNLQRAARRIIERGAFPREYDAIRELPGVGAYTAAAVASIAFGTDRAVVDGNVMRVIARFTGDSADIGAPATKIRFEKIAAALLDPRDPGRFNQAMMELGATICVPRNPLCLLCPVSAACQARLQGSQSQLPVKLKRMQPIRIEATLLVIERGGRILLWRRNPDSRRLGGFWELPSPEELPKARKSQSLGSFRHSIMNHNYIFTVVKATVSGAAKRFQWFDRAQLEGIPLSTTTRKALALIPTEH
jgi:A/G-specific adenine glycosylase